MTKFNPLLYTALFLLPLVIGCRSAEEQPLRPTESDLIRLVDPFIGTGAHGHTFPGAAAPMGMVQLSPETRWEGWDACSGYHYSDSSLYGFAHTHLSGTGCSDLGDLLFIPTTAPEYYRDSIHASRLPKIAFRHEDEEAHAGYYRVETEEGVLAELTATSLMGVQRYTFPKGSDSAAVVIDLVNIKGYEMVESSLELTSDATLRGYTIVNGWAPERHLYFAVQLSRPIREGQLFLDGEPTEGIAKGDSVRGIFSLDLGSERSVELFVGLSQTSMNAAEANLRAEMEVSGSTFDVVRQATESEWEALLSRAMVAEGSREDLTNFYTSLYHALLVPNRTSDVDGTYRGMDRTLHRSEGPSYSTLSLWDTFRALHPLLGLLYPEVVPDLCRSMMQMYDEGGELPIWPLYSGETRTMIGYHSVSVLADAYRMGLLGDLDPRVVLSAMVRSSKINAKGSDLYSQYGYVPSNLRNESVSCTLEYSYDDWCIAQMAEQLGDSVTSRCYYDRARSYLRLFDGGSAFFRGREEDGSWASDFDPYEVSKDFTEANAWQYRFAPMHDVAGMVSLYGGEEPFVDALDRLFSDETAGGDLQDITGTIGQYAHGNEPSHHIAYLYDYTDSPWRTQELTRQIMDEMYHATPDGISGNEDCGQMSAWYLFTALGLYPFAPGSGQLLLTTPRFREVTLSLPRGRLTITTDHDPLEYPYIRSVSLDGRPLHRLFVTTEELSQGGTLALALSRTPVPDVEIEEKPYSMTKEAFVSPVYSPDEITLFDQSTEVSLATPTPGSTIYYAIDGGERQQYEGALRLTESSRITAIAEREGLQPSPITTLVATRAEYHPAAGVTSSGDGAHWSLHHGEVASTGEIASLPIVSEGSATEISTEMRDRDDLFALTFRGYIDVPTTAVYEFRLTSDDGSVLSIDGIPVVRNDGSHAFVSATGKAALAEGLHPFTLLYWQGSEGQGLRLEYRRRGTAEYIHPTLKH